MNRWVQKSIEFANTPGYLDRLTEIYPAVPTEREPLPQFVKDKIKELIIANNFLEAIKLLVSLKGYPFPIVSILMFLSYGQNLNCWNKIQKSLNKLGKFLVH